MEYKQFGYDFIERTTELIKSTTSIHEKYDVTYLLNCCFGLITIPRETMIKQIPKIDLRTDQFGGINVEKILKSLIWDKSTQKYVADYSLSNVVKHLRYGISHGNIKQASISDGQIESIRIIDKYNDVVNFEIELTPIELKCFALELSKTLLNTKPT